MKNSPSESSIALAICCILLILIGALLASVLGPRGPIVEVGVLLAVGFSMWAGYHFVFFLAGIIDRIREKIG